VTVRFLADEDLDVAIIRGLLYREPAIDILDVKNSPLRDQKILRSSKSQPKKGELSLCMTGKR